GGRSVDVDLVDPEPRRNQDTPPARDADARSVEVRLVPGDHEAAGRVRGDGRVMLLERGHGVDPKSESRRPAGAVVSPTEDLAARGDRRIMPDDDEAAALLESDGRRVLVGRGRIHLEFRPDLLGRRVESLTEH